MNEDWLRDGQLDHLVDSLHLLAWWLLAIAVEPLVAAQAVTRGLVPPPLGRTLIRLRSVVNGVPAMTRQHAHRCRWAAGLVTALLVSQGVAVAAGPASPRNPAGPGLAPGCGPMGLQSADQRFIVMMIPHHDGAIAMAELALTRARRPQIKALAQQIKASQMAENAQMRRWYRQWYGTDVPAWTWGGMGMGQGMGMGMGMPGMATSLEVLRIVPDFDRAFMEQMIPHHRMGVMMASHAQWNTQHPELRELEAAMVRAQSQEIEQMAQWYRQWYGGSGS
ncbi:MAG: DUF305 domain-containing protein [Synechococcaceae bacterium WB9_2_112]|nr:DUF305 domain-containing protein [Synechococcaceae bacterium WB9_2_112]